MSARAEVDGRAAVARACAAYDRAAAAYDAMRRAGRWSPATQEQEQAHELACDEAGRAAYRAAK